MVMKQQQQNNASNLPQNQRKCSTKKCDKNFTEQYFFSAKFTQSRSVNLEEGGRVEHLEHPGVGEEDVFLHRVPYSIRPGVQEVLRRQLERVRSLSMTSANSADQDQTKSGKVNFEPFKP